ncbi:hypothetical protein BJV82DRAFT_554400 [Fennellomyces sp. T-0311]|nr:hypothetical protein BJV82DRAFT_554400 [Fennellomyces sp. T-0311]
MYRTALSVLLLSLFSMAYAIVWNAPITIPNENTIWTAGKSYIVKWNTTTHDGQKIPDGVSGMIKLGYVEDGSLDEHLYWDLAKDFPLNSGEQAICLPDGLEPKDNYIIVLMGNSGNASPKFTITRGQQ